MLFWCLPSSFRSIQLLVWEMSFEEFQDGIHGAILDSKRNDFSNSESLSPSEASLHVSAESNTVWGKMSFEEFQDGHHGGLLGYQNEMILAILNLYVAPMPPIKFRLNLAYMYGLGGDAVWRNSRWPPCRPSWISERTHSESPCCQNASH